MCCKKKEVVESRRTSMNSKKQSIAPTLPPEDTRPKIDESLVDHTSMMKAAIPVLPVSLAWFCLICNCLIPGFGMCCIYSCIRPAIHSPTSNSHAHTHHTRTTRQHNVYYNNNFIHLNRQIIEFAVWPMAIGHSCLAHANSIAIRVEVVFTIYMRASARIVYINGMRVLKPKNKIQRNCCEIKIQNNTHASTLAPIMNIHSTYVVRLEKLQLMFSINNFGSS